MDFLKEQFYACACPPHAAAKARTTVGVWKLSCIAYPTSSATQLSSGKGGRGVAAPLPGANRGSSFSRLLSSLCQKGPLNAHTTGLSLADEI